MKAKPRKRADEDKITSGRQSKYYYMERATLCEKILWRARHPVYGVRHPNEDGKLTEKEEGEE